MSSLALILLLKNGDNYTGKGRETGLLDSKLQFKKYSDKAGKKKKPPDNFPVSNIVICLLIS